jgi:hypothetical protein
MSTGGGDRKSKSAKSGSPILATPIIDVREQAAKEAGISHGSMSAYKAIKEAAPDRLDA